MQVYQKLREMPIKDVARFICQMCCMDCQYYDGWRNCHKTNCKYHAATGYKYMIQILKSEV